MLSIHFHRIVVFVLSISLYHHSLNNILRGLIVFLILYLFMIYVFFPKKIRCDHNLTQFKIVKKNDIFDEKWEFGTKKSLWKGYFLGNFLFFLQSFRSYLCMLMEETVVIRQTNTFKKIFKKCVFWRQNLFFGAA